MSEISRGLAASHEHNNTAPDYFGFYTREVAEVLTELDECIPFSCEKAIERTSGVVTHKVMTHNITKGKSADDFSSDGVVAALSDFKSEKLKALLTKTVIVLTNEVDEMLDPVLAMHQLKSKLRSGKCQSRDSAVVSDANAVQRPRKKLKISSSSSFSSIPEHASSVMCSSSKEGPESKDVDSKSNNLPLFGKEGTSIVEKECVACHVTETPCFRSTAQGLKVMVLCDACWSEYKKGTDSLSDSNTSAKKGYEEVDDDLKFLMETDSSLVEDTIKKHSDELRTTLGHMEKQLEELLDVVMSKCRTMTLEEKQQLQNLIQKLPPINLDRVVEILDRGKQLSGSESCKEIHVDLEKENNATLWRLYFYVETVERARKLSLYNTSPQLPPEKI